MNRLYRTEAAEYIGCSISKLYRMEKQGLMKGTFYMIGNRHIYVTAKLDEWIENGGELAAYEKQQGFTFEDEIKQKNVIPMKGARS